MRAALLAVVAVGLAFFASRSFASVPEGGAAEPESGGGWLPSVVVWLPRVEDGGGDMIGDAAPGARGILDIAQDIITQAGSENMSGGEQNMAAFLAMIRAAEGTAGENGYRTIIGGKLFDSFADHPRVRVQFTQTDGKINYSTAAGAYQFLAGTWDALRRRLSLSDFSPENQDAAAIELIRERGALRDVQGGRFDDAVKKVARIWASLPGAPYAQRTRSWDFVKSAYAGAGGEYA